MSETPNQKETTFHQELWQTFVDQWKKLMNWMKLNPNEPIILALLRYIYKIPVLLFVLFISPFALLFLVFTFVVLL